MPKLKNVILLDMILKKLLKKMLNTRLSKFKKRNQDLSKLSKQETVEIKLKALRKEFEDD